MRNILKTADEVVKYLARIFYACLKVAKEIIWFKVGLYILNSYLNPDLVLPLWFWMVILFGAAYYHNYVIQKDLEDKK